MTRRQRTAHRVLVAVARYQRRHGWPTRPRTPRRCEADAQFMMVCTWRRAQERAGAI